MDGDDDDDDDGDDDDDEAAGLLGWLDIRVISILRGLPGVFEKREWSSMDEISQDRFSDHSWD